MDQVFRVESAEVHRVACADLVAMAEQELGALFATVQRLFGLRQARAAAENWLQQLRALDELPISAREWRALTINVVLKIDAHWKMATEQPHKTPLAS